jgi:hypothetical protein
MRVIFYENTFNLSRIISFWQTAMIKLSFLPRLRMRIKIFNFFLCYGGLNREHPTRREIYFMPLSVHRVIAKLKRRESVVEVLEAIQIIFIPNLPFYIYIYFLLYESSPVPPLKFYPVLTALLIMKATKFLANKDNFCVLLLLYIQ